METVDLKSVAKAIIPDKSKVLYKDNAHNFTKVAFDVFQLNNAPVESYWILEKAEDGQEYLVAKYDEDTSLEVLASAKWDVLLDKDKKNATLSYKNTPIQRFASSDYGFTPEDAHLFQRALSNKMNTEKTFVRAFFESQSQERKKELLSKFPELEKLGE